MALNGTGQRIQPLRAVLESWQRSVVVRLLASFSFVLLITFFVGTAVTIQLAQNSLIQQSEQQLAVQRRQMQEHVSKEEIRLTQTLKPPLLMLAELSRAPLLHAESAIYDDSEQMNRHIVNQFRSCFAPDCMHSPINCLELKSRHFMPGAIRILNNTYITTAIHAVLANEDMRGIEVLDWEDNLYIGYISKSDGRMLRLARRFDPPPHLKKLEIDIKDDGEYLGQVLFHYHTERIDRMKADAESRIKEMGRMSRESIISQIKQLTQNRFMEALFFFSILFMAISFVVLRTIVYPLQKLRHSADQLADGQLDQKIDTHRRDELGSLAKSFEHMRQSIQIQIQELNVLITALNEAEHMYRTLFDNAGEMIFVSNTTGVLMTLNPACETLLGTSREHLTGQNIRTFLTHPEEWDIFHTLLIRLGHVQDYPMQLIHCSGAAIEVTISGTLYRPDEADTQTGIQGIVRDVTALRKAEEERLRLMKIEQEQQAAKAGNEAKSAFLANISHEIRTPLNAILGFSDILHTELKPDGSSRLISYVDAIQTSGRALLGLINDLLDLSRAEAGKFSLSYRFFSLKALLDEVQILFTPQTAKKGLSFALEMDSSLPDNILVRLDKNRCRQVLINLLGNAVKFTDHGDITLRCHASPALMDAKVKSSADMIGPAQSSGSDESNHTEESSGIAKRIDLTFQVEDSGSGISKSQQANIFDAFVQADSAKRTPAKGSGLGLAITWQLVNRMNGKISLTSQEGKGSCFKVRFKAVLISFDAELERHQMLDSDNTPHTHATLSSTLPLNKQKQHALPLSPSTPDTIDIETVSAPLIPENIELLREKLSAKQTDVKALLDHMIIDNIEAFALEMQSLAKEVDYDLLRDWAAQLSDSCLRFDIEKISESLLVGFDGILDALKTDA